MTKVAPSPTKREEEDDEDERTTTSFNPNLHKHPRRRSSITLATALAIKVTSSAKQSLVYLMQSFMFSTIASLWYIVGILVVFQNIDMPRYSYIYFADGDGGEESIFPSVYNNGLRVVPNNRALLSDYFVDLAPSRYSDVNDNSSLFYYWSKSYFFMHPSYMSLLVANIIFARVVFQPNRIGDFLIFLSTILFAAITFSNHYSETIISNLTATKPDGNGNEQSLLPALLMWILPSLFFLPITGAIATKTSINQIQRKHGTKVFIALLLFQLVVIIIFHLSLTIVFPSYFSERSTLVYKIFVRSFGITTTLHLMIELTWQLNRYLHFECEVHERCHLFMVVPIVFVNTVGRMMQAGSTDWGTSVVMECVASCVEIYISHGLLLGFTPLVEFQYVILKIRMKLCKSERVQSEFAKEQGIAKKRRVSAKVKMAERRKRHAAANSAEFGENWDGMFKQFRAAIQPMSGSSSNNGASEGSSSSIDPSNENSAESVSSPLPLEAEADSIMTIDMLREQFCVNCILYMTMSEGALTLFCLIFSLAVPFNLSSPGSAALPKSQAIASFVIMFTGEVVITNSAVAWLSKHSRYGVDLSIAWAARDKHLFNCFALILAFVPIQGFAVVFNSLCLTSYSDIEYVFTTCPVKPDSLMDMSRVGNSWNSTWIELMNGGG